MSREVQEYETSELIEMLVKLTIDSEDDQNCSRCAIQSELNKRIRKPYKRSYIATQGSVWFYE